MTAYGTDDNNAYSGGFSNAYGGSNLSSDVGDSTTGKAYNNNNNNVSSSNWMSAEDRLRDIEAREQRAIELEKELDEKEGKISKQYKGYRPPKDWPSKRFAFARHNINRDIPSKFQNHVKKFYSLWWLVVMSTIVNWINVIWYGAYAGKTNFMSYVLLPTLYMVVGSPCAWMFWYKRYYKAMQNNGNLSYMFFVFFGLQILWSGVMGLGFTSLGSCGILLTFQTWINDSKDQLILCLFMTIGTLFWWLSCLVGMYMVKLAHFDLGQFLAQKYAPMAAQMAQDHAKQQAQSMLSGGNNNNNNNNNNDNTGNNIWK